MQSEKVRETRNVFVAIFFSICVQVETDRLTLLREDRLSLIRASYPEGGTEYRSDAGYAHFLVRRATGNFHIEASVYTYSSCWSRATSQE